MKKKKTTNWEQTSAYIDSVITQKNKQKQQKKNQNAEISSCPNCNQIITFHNPITTSFTLNCPLCNHPMKDSKKKNHGVKQAQKKSKRKPFLSKHFPKINLKEIIQNNLVELILIIIGLIYLLQPTPPNIKISFTLIFIATILLFLMTGEHPESFATKKITTSQPFFRRNYHIPTLLKKLDMIKQKIRDIPLTNRISIVLILWTLLLYGITVNVEIYFILIFIGVLITRELTDLYTSKTFKTRLNAYIAIFLFTYIMLISQKIMQILAS